MRTRRLPCGSRRLRLDDTSAGTLCSRRVSNQARPGRAARPPPRLAVSQRRSPAPLIALLVILLALLPAALGAQQLDVIRGQVTNPEQQPIENANVTATSVSGGVNRTARTDRGGRFTITFPGGEGDYFVTFTAIGYAPRRFEVRRTADQEILVADAQLQRMTLLDTARAVAARARVNRNDTQPDLSGTEQSIQNGAVSSAQQGDLDAMAATHPRRHADHRPERRSGRLLRARTFGRSEQHDAQWRQLRRVERSARRPGRLVARHHAVRRQPRRLQRRAVLAAQRRRLELHPPDEQPERRCAAAAVDRSRGARARPAVHEPVARRTARRPDRVRQGVLQPLVPARPPRERPAHAAQHRRGRPAGGRRGRRLGRATARHRCRAADPDCRRQRPRVEPSQRPGHRCSAASTSRRRDRRSGTTINLTFNGNWNRQTPAGNLTTELPGTRRRPHQLESRRADTAHVVREEHPAQRDDAQLQRQPQLRHAVPPDAERQRARELQLSRRHERRAHARLRRQRVHGHEQQHAERRGDQPAVVVQPEQQAPPEAHAASCVARATIRTRPPTRSARSPTTRWRISQPTAPRRTPARCSRACRAPASSSARCRSATRIGATRDLQIQYGVRLDGNRFSATPPFNSELETAFGVRNDRMPNRLYVSPRIGFSWNYGTAPQIAGFDGAVRGPRAVVRGGVGVFQTPPNANSIGTAIDNTGLAERRAAGHLRRRGGAGSRLVRVRAEPRVDPDPVRRRHHRRRVRQHGAERHAVRHGLPGAAQRALEPELERTDARQPVQCERRSHVLAQPQSGQHARPELPAHAAVHARRRGRTPGVRATGKHRPGDGRDRVARRARVAAVHPREPAAESISAARASSFGGPLPRLVHAGLHLDRVNYTLADVREQFRGFQSTSAIRSTSPGRAPRASRATRSRTRSATTSSTPCA